MNAQQILTWLVENKVEIIFDTYRHLGIEIPNAKTVTLKKGSKEITRIWTSNLDDPLSLKHQPTELLNEMIEEIENANKDS